MGVLYGRAVSLAVPFFILLIVVEFAADRIGRRGCYHLADSICNMSCGIVSTGTRVFFGFIGLFIYQWIYQHWAPVHLPKDKWWVWAFAFVLYDFCYYWHHRFSHTMGLFWACHSVHHQSEEFNLTTALRQPGTGAFTNWIFYLAIPLCGIPMEVYLLAAVAQ